MTNTAKLSGNQAKALDIMLPLIAQAAAGEISEYEARTAGATMTALPALVRKGILVRRYAPFTLPTGPYAGQTVNEAYYSAA